MKDWPEKPSLEPKTAGRTYLEWLSTASERSRPTPQRPVGLEVLREQYRQNQPIKRKLLSFARLYKRHGRRCLSQWHQLPPGVSWEAVEVALKGIVKNGLVEEEPAHTLKAGRATRGARKHA
jgi:hypothetical protein